MYCVPNGKTTAIIHANKSALKTAPPTTLPLSLNNKAVRRIKINTKLDASKTRFPKMNDMKTNGTIFVDRYKSIGIPIFNQDFLESLS